jgi:site-specific recombinase XerD
MESLYASSTVDESGLLVSRFNEYLVEQGYAQTTTVLYMAVAHQIIEWFITAKESMSLNELFGMSIAEVHAQSGLLKSGTHRAVFHHLRRIHMNMSDPTDEKPTPVQKELEAYCRYLDQVCGLAPATRISRRRIIGEFLSSRFGDGQIDTSSFESHDLMQYVALRVRGYKPGTASVIATAIRSYLKFLQFRGDVDPALVRIIPSPPQWRLQDFPTVLSDIQVTALMNSFDLSHPAGLRDSAMTLCMLHIGLRAGEVANLTLDDLNWRRSILYIRRDKSRTCRELPLLTGCGNALANYLKRGRPSCTSRKVFVRHTVPIGSDMTAENVRGAMRRAYERAGFPRQWTGTHILRHTAATHMLNKGATLKEVADVLGHKSIDTTVIYTKVNSKGLQAVSQPWPGALS